MKGYVNLQFLCPPKKQFLQVAKIPLRPHFIKAERLKTKRLPTTISPNRKENKLEQHEADV
jgi:hypothetical protein